MTRVYVLVDFQVTWFLLDVLRRQVFLTYRVWDTEQTATRRILRLIFPLLSDRLAVLRLSLWTEINQRY